MQASANIPDLRGCFPLHLAAWRGNADICRILLRQGPSVANVNAQVRKLICSDIVIVLGMVPQILSRLGNLCSLHHVTSLQYVVNGQYVMVQVGVYWRHIMCFLAILLRAVLSSWPLQSALHTIANATVSYT